MKEIKLSCNIKEKSVELSKGEIAEINDYTKYLKYSRKGLIKTGNKNWLLIDSSKTKTKQIIEEITRINTFNHIITNVIADIEYINFKYGFDQNRFLSCIKNNNNYCNILVISSFNSDVAFSKFNIFCTFYIDYNEVDNSLDKKEKIETYLENNNFKLENSEVLTSLEIAPTKELETILTKAFISALNNHTNVLKQEYISKNSKDLSLYMNELEDLIGLKNTKKTLIEIINYLQVSKKRNDVPVLNMCFLGNPGTGKTTVAKLVGKILSAINVFGTNAPFVQVSREELVGKYIGHTENNVLEAVKNATGGVLFIDEAYSLTSNNDDNKDFGNRAIDTLVNQLDVHRSDLCVIFAGYKEEMLDFLESNPGLESRVPFVIEFEDYTEQELLEMFKNLLDSTDFYLDKDVEQILHRHFKEKRLEGNFGNGRYVRNLFERLKIKQANRIIQNKDNDLNMITKEDIINTIESMKKIKRKSTEIGFQTF